MQPEGKTQTKLKSRAKVHGWFTDGGEECKRKENNEKIKTAAIKCGFTQLTVCSGNSRSPSSITNFKPVVPSGTVLYINTLIGFWETKD